MSTKRASNGLYSENPTSVNDATKGNSRLLQAPNGLHCNSYCTMLPGTLYPIVYQIIKPGW